MHQYFNQFSQKIRDLQNNIKFTGIDYERSLTKCGALAERDQLKETIEEVEAHMKVMIDGIEDESRSRSRSSSTMSVRLREMEQDAERCSKADNRFDELRQQTPAPTQPVAAAVPAVVDYPPAEPPVQPVNVNADHTFNK